MSEICTPPAVTIDPNGDKWEAFGPHHSLSDIARWLMQNPVDAQEVCDILHLMLAEIADKKELDTRLH
jgi:hypothetical protein